MGPLGHESVGTAHAQGGSGSVRVRCLLAPAPLSITSGWRAHLVTPLAWLPPGMGIWSQVALPGVCWATWWCGSLPAQGWGGLPKGTSSDMVSHVYMPVTYTHQHTLRWVSLGFFLMPVPVLLVIVPVGAAHNGREWYWLDVGVCGRCCCRWGPHYAHRNNKHWCVLLKSVCSGCCFFFL